MSAPITEEDRPHIEAMIKRLVRYRKRETEHSKFGQPDLDEAIRSLRAYGELKGWWQLRADER